MKFDYRYNTHKRIRKTLIQNLSLLTGIFAISAGVAYARMPSVLPVSPLSESPESAESITLVQSAQAQGETPEPVVVTKTEIKNVKVIKSFDPKKAFVKEAFGEDGDKMIKIISECENSTWDQSRVNTYNRDGSKDYGLAQVNDKNEYLCRGLDYKNDWQDNIRCAFNVYKQQGLSAWACSHVVGETPFYAK